MNAPIVLSRGDHARLKSLLAHECPKPWPNPIETSRLKAILHSAALTDDEAELRKRARLGARVSLVSPTDTRDEFTLRLVMPHEADVDAGWIPVTLPISLAVIGRSLGEVVSWMTPGGSRMMRIVTVGAHSEPATPVIA
jgi:transcription elongation GreA/GreB family factor